METTLLITFITTLLSVLNPISVIPLYLAFTEDDIPCRSAVARTTSFTVAIVMVISVFAGEEILRFFGITVAGFRIAGGILLLTVAFSMLNARISRTKHTDGESTEARERESVAIIPLAIPLIAGPGTISTVILLSSEQPHYSGKMLLAGACVFTASIVWLALRLGPQISERIGKTGMNIVTRIMGLILASIAVEFIIGGLRVVLPGLAG
jgi:multiple antibiotic resistance protein